MPSLPNTPGEPVDNDFIRTEWGSAVVRFIEAILNTPDGAGQIPVFTTTGEIDKINRPTNRSVLVAGPGNPDWEDFVDTESWAQVGNTDRVPLTKQFRQMAIHTGATLPSVGPQGQLLLINVPPHPQYQQNLPNRDFPDQPLEHFY